VNVEGKLGQHVAPMVRSGAALPAALVGLLIVLGVWWVGPDLFGPAPEPDERVVAASVVEPVSCASQTATQETVRFTVDGDERDALLSACGHDEGESVDIAVPEDLDADPLLVRAADTLPGHRDLRRPVGMLLMVLSCLAGGGYAALLAGTGRAGNGLAERELTKLPQGAR
jgi:hypothetical protein